MYQHQISELGEANNSNAVSKCRLLLVRCIARQAGTLFQKKIKGTRSKQGQWVKLK
jgi:hypothetical protein